MKLAAKKIDLASLKTDCLVVAAYSNGKLSSSAKALEKQTSLSLKSLYDNKDFSGKTGQLITLHQVSKSIGKVIILGFGQEKKTTADSFRKAIGSLGKALGNNEDKKVSLLVDEVSVESWSSEDKARSCAEALVHSQYEFTECKSTKSKKATITLSYGSDDTRASNKGLKIGEAIGKGMNVARELGNLPGNICTPTYLAGEARKLARKNKSLTTSILSEKQMKALGMGSLLSVSAGSAEPAQLIVMEYKGGSKSTKPHVLVGKGITFDTGGISLKPGGAMDEMKFDMCGAASVFGTMNAIVDIEPKMNVVAIVAAAENMPGSKATKPGDIVTSMSGQTIEILNTDAEGRLVLCDALTYAEKFKPASVVDIATLTGACVVALGKHATGLFSNDDELAEALLTAGKATGDRAWHMPMWDEYQPQLDSNFADMANIGGRDGGSITAACFLSRYTKKYKWAHLDIAGTAWHSGAKKGATGRPVPLLTDYLLTR
ncbi:MAG: leucyl aminopeptidase [Cellvibrionaceae bacterium]